MRVSSRSPSPVDGALSVVVPVFNALHHTKTCLRSLAESTAAEVVVVDNGSTDGTGAWLEGERATSPWLRVVHLESNLGFAAGCNAGIEAAQGEFVAVLNNDTVVPPDLFARLLAAWRRVPRAGLVAPVSNYVKGRQLLALVSSEEAHDVEAVSSRLARDCPGAIEETGSLAGLCLFARRAWLRDIGAFDAGYGLGNFEDDDLCLRVRLAGFRLLIARDAYVYHVGSATFQELGLDYARQYAEQQSVHDAKWRQHPLYRIESPSHDEDPAHRLATIESLVDRLEPGSPAWAWACFHLAHALEDLQRTSEAIEPWRVFVRHHELHPDGSARLALALLRCGHEEEGREEMARLLRHCFLDATGGASVLTQFAHWCRDADYRGEAQEHLTTALLLDPEFLPAWNTRAVWLLEAEQHAEAEATLVPYRDRGDADVLANLGIALYRQGRVEEAVTAFREGATIAGPESPAARNLKLVRGA